MISPQGVAVQLPPQLYLNCHPNLVYLVGATVALSPSLLVYRITTLLHFFLRTAVFAVGKHRVPDLAACSTLFKQHRAARRASVRLILAGQFTLREDLVDGSSRPEEKLSRAGAYRILANRTQKPLISFAVLPHQPIQLGKGHDFNKVDQNSGHHG